MTRAAVAGLLLIVLGAGASSFGMASTGARPGQAPTGEWRVTALTGAVVYATEGPAPPQGLCEPGSQTYRAIAEDSFIELAVLEHGNRPIVASRAEQELARVMNEFGELMPTERDLVAPVVDPARLFLFGFAFENGYHSNEVLDAEVEFVPTPDEWQFTRMVAAYRDAQDQAKALDTFASVLSDLNAAFGGGEGYVGTWLPAEGRPAFLESGYRIFGVEGLLSGGGDAGKSLFLVLGKLDDARSMSGEWYFKENSRLLDCTSSGSGSGTWAAVR